MIKDKLGIGFFAGIIGAFIGFGLYYVGFKLMVDQSLIHLFQESENNRSSIISISLLFNLIVFSYLMKKELYNAGKGVILSMFFFGAFVVYFKVF